MGPLGLCPPILPGSSSGQGSEWPGLSQMGFLQPVTLVKEIVWALLSDVCCTFAREMRRKELPNWRTGAISRTREGAWDEQGRNGHGPMLGEGPWWGCINIVDSLLALASDSSLVFFINELEKQAWLLLTQAGPRQGWVSGHHSQNSISWGSLP